MPKYIITYGAGDVEISYEAASKEEALAHVDDLLELSKAILDNIRSRLSMKASKRRGKSETVEILKILEEKLIPSDFFDKPRSTAEVRQRIKELVNIQFQSRKVSQALGILYDRNILGRTGLRGGYKYYLRR